MGGMVGVDGAMADPQCGCGNREERCGHQRWTAPNVGSIEHSGGTPDRDTDGGRGVEHSDGDCHTNSPPAMGSPQRK